MPLPRIRSPRLAQVLALGLVALVAAGCSGVGLMPPNAVTTQGEATHNLYVIVFVIAAIIFFLVEGLILFAAIRYRRRPHVEARADGTAGTEIADPLPPQIHGHAGLEFLWTAIPIGIVLFLFVASWQTLNTVQARAADPAANITVVGFQWQWEFVYPNPSAPNDPAKAVTVIGLPNQPPELHVPAGQTVQITLKGQDVIHAFYVPQFLFKEDAVPGRENVFQFKIDSPGRYAGQCAEFCGLGHANMLFTVVAQTPAEYQSWLQGKLSAAAATPSPAASGSAAASGPAASGAAGSGTTVNVTAQGVQFTTKDLTAPANAAFTIHFANQDNGVPHNVAIKDASGTVKFAGTIVTGSTTTDYQVGALPAGTYTFFCQVHPNMTGTLTVK